MSDIIKPAFITFTGADDLTDIDGMVALSQQYPIEWGILFSPKRQGTGRYPSANTQSKLWALAVRQLVLSAHLCGEYSRRVMDGKGLDDMIPVDFGYCSRIQVNHVAPDASRVLEFVTGLDVRRGIVQCRNSDFPEDDRVDYLFDCSGGHGKMPQSWPKHPGGNRLVGYAGGINPSNVLEVIEKINTAGRYWLDMESGIRTNDRFDLALCQFTCELVWPK